MCRPQSQQVNLITLLSAPLLSTTSVPCISDWLVRGELLSRIIDHMQVLSLNTVSHISEDFRCY